MLCTVKPLNQIARRENADKGPDRVFRQHSQCGRIVPEPYLWRSVGPRRRPQRQHTIETEAIDRLRDAALLDLPRDRAQAERVEGNGSRRAQGSQVTEPRRQLEIAHRQIALDVFLRDQPRTSGFLVAELIDQLEIDRLAAGADACVRSEE